MSDCRMDEHDCRQCLYCLTPHELQAVADEARAERDSLKARVIELTNELIAKEAWASRLCAESVLAEREACAKICRDLYTKPGTPGDARDCYDEIRARGKR